ncbi:pyrroline-5-carboxylate reductase [Gracilibacillus sp. YIM 98692]|uniref:pyrroline-5-carboxylate reductase n=1 Tax=Gracilibacillus sp. YIM 98692 TaxID=2663532 RepID=UPI0013CF872B|nr:pyrroline-5-carboxylate reductase [Gracilibacillus sp. YIM 98692]
MNQTIAFLGAGSMAEAIIAGMTAKEIVPSNQIIATNRTNQERLTILEDKYEIQTSQDKQKAIVQSDMIILAMKPKDITTSVEEILPYITKGKIVVSLLAGISTSFIEKQLDKEIPVVRVMPNTSATIGQSATTIAKGTFATDKNMQLVETLMQSIGTTTVINEEDMDAFTALAGSGPAFYYYMVEAMEQFVQNNDLDMEIAKPLMIQTLQGVTEMLKESPDSPKVLREKITSPGGTTEAGLNVLASYDFQKAVYDCLEKAAQKSGELRKAFEK